MPSRGAHRARIAAAAALVLISAGCARVLGGYDVAASGLPEDEDRLRRLVSAGEAASALQRLDQGGPGDDVLHVLYEGVLAYHAGDFARAARMLDAAGYMADDRITKSLSRAALSLVSNDLALPYAPARTERLMIPYYAALARTRLGDTEGAAVEARRLSLLLQLYRDDDEDVDASLAATLHLVAAAAFEANGDGSDAEVAYRNAASFDSTLERGAHAGGAGTVYVIVEHGFVAHRVEQGLAVMLLPEEVYAIAHGSSDDRSAASGFVAARVLERAATGALNAADSQYGRTSVRGGTLFVPAPEHSLLPKTRTTTECRTVTESAASSDTAAVRPVSVGSTQECTQREEEIDELPYLLKVAWPVLNWDGAAPRRVRIVDSTARTTAAAASVSRGVVADFEAERMLIVARTIARGAAKLALTKGAEKQIEERNELAGRLVGLLGNVGSVLLERADTRSWHLLPATLSVVRLDLPAGRHELIVEAGDRAIPLDIDVHRGGTTIVPLRSW